MGKIVNRRALYDYSINYKVEGGLELKGNEVKSIESGMCAMNGSWCRFIDGELFITGILIKPWLTSNAFDINENRDIKVLLHKRELRNLFNDVKLNSVSIVPLSIYKTSNGKYKVELGVGKGNKKYDKREIEKKKQIARDIERSVK